MPRDTLKALKEFFYQFENLHWAKITPKTISDGYFFMQFLSNIDCHHFDTTQMSKPPQETEKARQQFQLMSSFGKVSQAQNNNKQLDLMQKMKNWKLLIRKVKEFFHERFDKGIKYGDIDLVDVCKNCSMEQIAKLFELVLCVVANCEIKDELISKIMLLEESTQSVLAVTMQQALESRICSLETEQRMDLIEELQLKEQQIASLYGQVQRLQQLNSEYVQKIQEYEKSANQLEYEKQKIKRFNKKNSLIHDINNPGSNSFIQRSHEDSYQMDYIDQTFMGIDDSFNFQSNKGTTHKIIESLKNRLMREQEEHENEVEQLHQKIYELQEQLKERAHFEELLVIYQEKYQQALAYVEKVTQYEKQKNKICQEIIQKDIIIEQLKSTISQINQRLVQVEQQKIDLQLLLAKKNNERLTKNHPKPTQKQSSQFQQLCKTNFPLLKKQQTSLPLQSKLSKTHNRQISESASRNHDLRLSSTIYPYYEEDSNSRLEELQIKVESQSLEIKRLQRKEKELAKHNTQLKTKLQKMRKIENQNKKLSNIIVELHTRKDEETQILVSCLHQTFLQYDFKFHKLIGDNFTHNHQLQTIVRKKSASKSQFNDLSNLPNPQSAHKMSAFNTTFSSEQFSSKNKKQKRNPSIRVQSQKQILEVSMNKEETQNHLE